MGMFNKLTDHCKLVDNGKIQYYIIDRMDEVKKEMLRLLSVVDKICRQKGLKYWIDGGTMIGAVRHKGFIPWDDDIDISLLKTDYNILLNELRSQNYSDDIKEYLWFDGINQYEHCCNYLCSKINIYGRMKGSFGIVPIKLDIRPVNVIKNSNGSLQINAELREIANEWIFKKKVKPLTNLSEKYQQMSKQEFFKFYNEEYGFEENNADSILALPYYEYANEGFLSNDLFEHMIECRYENMVTFIPKKYDEYLKMFYGDYMQLPPLESRVPAEYEYISSKLDFSKIRNYINSSDKTYLQIIIDYINLFGVKKFFNVVFDKLSNR